MHRITTHRLTLAALTTVTLAALARPAAAQNLYITSGSYTANDATYQNGIIFVGEDSTGNKSANGTPYVAALLVRNSAGVNEADAFNGNMISVTGGSVSLVQGFDASATTISGGNVSEADARNASNTTISGGSVGTAQGYDTSTTAVSSGSVGNTIGNNNSTINISDGTVMLATGNAGSVTNISGGSVGEVDGYDSAINISAGAVTTALSYGSSKFSVSGGTLTNGLELIDPSATANFVGTGLTYTSNGYNTTSSGGSADTFTVSGFFGGASQSYVLYVDNPNGATGTPNPAPHQFTFNGRPPTAATVPEAGTLALALPAFAIGAISRCRNRKS